MVNVFIYTDWNMTMNFACFIWTHHIRPEKYNRDWDQVRFVWFDWRKSLANHFSKSMTVH